MAMLNGKHVHFTGKTFAEIGKMLQEASPRKDGTGPTLELTPAEAGRFEIEFGFRIGYAICTLIADAAVADGKNTDMLRYTHRNRVFKT